MPRDWFESLVGFREDAYESTRKRLAVEGDELVSLVTDARHGIGSLSMPALSELRAAPIGARGGRRCAIWWATRASLHSEPEFEGAMFQVASQFNLLEMTGPDVTPDDGVTRYAWDGTQGLACAMAAGAATIFRNYFAPVDGQIGQTRDRQQDALESLGEALASGATALWEMRNGWALCTIQRRARRRWCC